MSAKEVMGTRAQLYPVSIITFELSMLHMLIADRPTRYTSYDATTYPAQRLPPADGSCISHARGLPISASRLRQRAHLVLCIRQLFLTLSRPIHPLQLILGLPRRLRRALYPRPSILAYPFLSALKLHIEPGQVPVPTLRQDLHAQL